MKICGNCGVSKPLEEFHKHRRHKDGKQPWCKDCQCARALKNVHKSDAKKLGLKWHPEAHYKLLWVFQSNKCWTCGVKQNGRKLHRDHNHISGWLRGLLCDNCNHLLPSEFCDGSISDARKYLAGTGMKKILVDIYVDYLKNPPYFQLLRQEGIKLSKKSQKNYSHFLKEGTLF